MSSAARALALPIAFAVGLASAYRGGGYVLAQWAPIALVGCVVAGAMAWTGARDASTASDARRSRWLYAAVAAVVGYAAWSIVAVAWSSDRFAAHEEAARTAFYAALLLAAAVVARTRRRVEWGVGAWTALACVVACSVLWRFTDLSTVVFAQGRLLGTLGYPNGWAALLLAPVTPALALGSTRSLHPAARACLVGGATLLVLVAAMSQSRGALVALALALLVAVLLAPHRTRLLATCAVVAVAVAATWPRLSEVYRVRPRTPAPIRDAVIADARLAVLLAAVAALVVVAVAALLDERWSMPRRTRRTLVAATWVVLLLAVAASAVTFARNDLLVGRLDSLRDRSTAARVDLWQVALRDAEEHPVTGVGPGNVDATIYRYRDRVYPRTPRQVHQLVLENLAERGVVGAALLLAAVLGILGVALRARRRTVDGDARMLLAGLVGAGAGWFAHAQVDWTWHLTAVTAPVAVCAGCLLASERWMRHGATAPVIGARLPGGVAVVAIALLVPLVVADQLMTDTRRSLESRRIGAAADSAREATTWAPHSVRAWQLRAQAYAALGDVDRATEAYETSRRRSPDFWRTHATAATYFSATGQERRARDARDDAARLDPHGFGSRLAAPGRDPATR